MVTNVNHVELKRAMEEKKLIRTYRDANGVDALTDPIPVWKLEQLMRAFGQVSVLEKELAELKDELRETSDEATKYKLLYSQVSQENNCLSERLARIDDEFLFGGN